MSSCQKYSPLDWLDYFDQEDEIRIPDSNDVFHIYKAGSDGPVIFCLHGGGYCGLSFALAASKIKEKAQVVAMDLRGHGKSSTENELDLSIETLCNDVIAVLKTMYGDSPPAIVLVGHSMGGSVAVHIAAKKAISGLSGLVVVDVVEGTAMASLIHMQKILSNRMQYFSTIEKAIEWSVKGGSLRNIECARVSIPGTLKFDDSKKCYIYRARLEETEQYWRGWYEGLSEKFLSSPVPKLLLLAGTDRLDRALTIGQMQGKFQMVVVRHTGHAIQEDVPDEFANLILNFISHNRIGPHGIEGYTDEDWAGSPSDRKTTTGYCIFVEDRQVHIISHKYCRLCTPESQLSMEDTRNLQAIAVTILNQLVNLNMTSQPRGWGWRWRLCNVAVFFFAQGVCSSDQRYL